MLINVFKRLLVSDFNISEINSIIEDLSKHKLYPIKPKTGKSFLRKLMSFIFDKKYMFLFSILIYRIFKKPIQAYIIKKSSR